MGLSKLSIWVRDTAHPCLPYQSTGHSWIAIILTCDLQPLHFGEVKNGVYALTDPGKAGGKVHGQPKVPPGCYIVLAVATCKNIYTDMAMAQVGCDQEVCVNLITKSLSTCSGQLIAALNIASVLGPGYAPSSPAGREIPKEVISKATDALEELVKHIPHDPILPALPISLDDLKKMAREEREAKK
jgi:hypothetical protein